MASWIRWGTIVPGAPTPAFWALEASPWREAARVCREADARVATDVFLRELNIELQGSGERQLEVIANGLPLWRGAQVAVDTTIVSPIRRDGRPKAGAATTGGMVLREAQRRKQRTYPELVQGRRCRLQVLAMEVGGRWSESSRTFLRLLARARARAVPAGLRGVAQGAYAQRWAGLLAVAGQRALAATLLDLPATSVPHLDGETPDLSEVLDDARGITAPTISRLPARG